MQFKSKIFKLATTVVLLLSGFYIFNNFSDKKVALANINTKQVVEVFKTPSCGCCNGYVLFLEKEKFKVKQTDMKSLQTVKQKYNIPLEMQSCHTTIMGEYFIALPGMPIGTPGMPGEKDEPYVIYQLIDGKSSVFMTI